MELEWVGKLALLPMADGQNLVGYSDAAVRRKAAKILC